MIDAVFHSRRIQSQSVRYRIIGKGKRALFLHGAWVDPFIFSDLFEVLSNQYEILIPDIPPFGQSRSRRMLSLGDYAVLFDEMLESIGWEDASVVGHSLGGGIALHLAAKSKRISRVVVCNPIGIPFRRPDILMKYPTIVYRALINLMKASDNTIIRKLLTDVGRVLLKNPITPIAQTITQCLCEDSAVFQKITVPATVIWGEKDEMLPSSYMKNIQQIVPHVRILFIEGHHNWCLVNQKLAGDLILQNLCY